MTTPLMTNIVEKVQKNRCGASNKVFFFSKYLLVVGKKEVSLAAEELVCVVRNRAEPVMSTAPKH